MNISFDKIDCFTGIIKEAKAILQADDRIMAIIMMNNKPKMREGFININNSNKSKECKRIEQIRYIIDLWKLTNESAKRFGFNNVQELAESRLKQLFNEELFLKESLSIFYKVMACDSNYQLQTNEGINRFIREAEISIGTKINESDIIGIAQMDIPQIKNIEAEFWNNCPTPTDVEQTCSFYYARLSGNIDTDTINWFNQKVEDKYLNLNELVLCGLLDNGSLRIIERCFIMLSALGAGLCGEIVDFFNKLLPLGHKPTQHQQLQYQNGKHKINYIGISLNRDIIDEIYSKCNGKQWAYIEIDQFINILNGNGKNKSLSINVNETNRTKCVFRKISNYIEDKEMRKRWIEDIRKNIFNGTDFMKATLRIDKLSSGYSNKDVEFESFLDRL